MNSKAIAGIILGAALCVGGYYFISKQQPSAMTNATTNSADNANSRERAPEALPLVNSVPLRNEPHEPTPASQDQNDSNNEQQKPELLAKLLEMQKVDFENVRNFITGSMGEIAGQIAEELEDGQNDEEQQKLLNKINKATQDALDYVETRIAQTYEEKFSAEELQELIELQEDPVFKAVKESALVQDLQDFKQEYNQFVEGLPDNPPSPVRESILREIVEDSNIKEIFEKINSSLADQDPTLNQMSPEQKSVHEAEFNKEIQAIKDQSYQGLQFALRDFNDEQLTHYGKILKTKVMRKGQDVQKELVPELIEKTFKDLSKVIDEG